MNNNSNNNGFEDMIEFLAFSPFAPGSDNQDGYDAYDGGNSSGGCGCIFVVFAIILALGFIASFFEGCTNTYAGALYKYDSMANTYNPVLDEFIDYGFFNNDYDPVREAYKGGEPDYADGDLEDKLGDSGYYYDLFEEERQDEPEDYEDEINKNKSNNKKKIYKSDININDQYIRNMPDYNTRSYRIIGAVSANGKTYYKNADGTFHRGWKEENGYYYYFEPTTLALVTNELKDINGAIYYFNEYGQMERNKIIEIAGIKVKIDNSGICSVVSK